MASKSSHRFKLPGFLRIKQTPNEGRGLFAKKRVRCGEEVLRCKPYVVGVSATTAAGLRQVCHQCAKSIPTSSSAVVCDQCQIAAYCCKSCQDEALPVHRIECGGLRELEKLRNGKTVYKPFSECTFDYWPPSPAMLTTRALNRKVMEGKSMDEWEITSLSKPEKLPPYKADAFNVSLPHMWPLVLTSITTEEMLYDVFCRVCANASQTTESGIQMIAVYTEFSLLNHCCVPNCYDESEDGEKVVRTLSDIDVGEQLCISYISDVHRLLPGEFRRKKLMEVFGFECMCTVCLEEKNVGSKMWSLEQQKKLFFAPWSHETANCAMEEGRKTLMRLIELQDNKDWERVVEESEAIMETCKKVLDNRNVILYLLSKALLEAYIELNQLKKALRVANVVLMSAKEYETRKGVQEVMMLVSLCHYKTGNSQMGTKIAGEAMKLYPVMLTPQDWCKSLAYGGIQTVAPPPSGRKFKVDLAKVLT